jgi:energy-coupling factor transporter ATP-binding protein EcfA2
MQTVEKTISKLVDQLRETVLLIKMLHERVQEIESRIVVLENNKNVMTAVSSLIPVTEIDDEIPITAEQYTMQKEVADVDTKRD